MEKEKVNEVVSSNLWRKFLSILKEAEADSGSPSHIISSFQSIQRKIQSHGASQIPVDHLYNLIEALSDFRVFTYQRRRQLVAKKYFHLLALISGHMFKRKMGKRLGGIEAELLKHWLKDSRPGDSPQSTGIQQTGPINPSLIIGFDAQAEKIEAWLTSNKEEGGDALKAIGIVGRCGCGKTALAQKVFASPRIMKEFSPRIWVCLSNMLFDADPRVTKVNCMLKEMGHAAEQKGSVYSLYTNPNSLAELLEKLQLWLMGKRYLIVLDNAWRPRDSDPDKFLSQGLPKGSGGAVIVTSRRENVIRKMVGDKHLMHLEPPNLKDEICWQIFSSVAHSIDQITSELKAEVIRNFDGLPLAAEALAKILSPQQ